MHQDMRGGFIVGCDECHLGLLPQAVPSVALQLSCQVHHKLQRWRPLASRDCFIMMHRILCVGASGSVLANVYNRTPEQQQHVSLHALQSGILL